MPFFRLEIATIAKGVRQPTFPKTVRGKSMTTAIRSYAERFLVKRGERQSIILGKGQRTGSGMHYFIHKDEGEFRCSMLASITVINPPPIRSIYD